MDPNNPREQGLIDEMRDMDGPLTGTVPGPGRSLPSVPAENPETRIAHGAIASDKGVPNALAAEDPTTQPELGPQIAQEDWQKLGSITRRNTEDSTRSLKEKLEKAQEEIRNLRVGLKYNESEANGILRKENAKYNQYIKTTTTELEQLRAENAKMQENARKTQLKLQAKEEGIEGMQRRTLQSPAPKPSLRCTDRQ